MRDPARIDTILEKLGKSWKEYPDLRLGQLIVIFMGPDRDVFNFEDDELLERIENKQW